MLYILYLLIICMYIYIIYIWLLRLLAKAGCSLKVVIAFMYLYIYILYIYIYIQFNTHIQIHPKYMCPPVIKRENGTSSQHSLFPIKLPASHVRSSPRSCPGTYEDWHPPSQLDVPPLTGAPSWTAMQSENGPCISVYTIRLSVYVYINIQ